jgi:hypothetical protein
LTLMPSRRAYAATATPLDIATTVLPTPAAAAAASRIQWKAWPTSTSQLRLKVSHVCKCTGRENGAGVEHERFGPVLLDQGSRHDGVGDVGHHRGERDAQLVAQ